MEMSFWSRNFFLLVSCSIPVFSFQFLWAEADIHALPAMTVEVGGDQGELIHRDDSLAESLEFLPGTILYKQGGGERQADLSIRNSSFSGAGLAVSGLALANPQTAHFNAELPLPMVLFHSPEVLTGLRQGEVDDPNLVGTIGLDFKPAEEFGYIEAEFGERARYGQSAFYAGELDSLEKPGELFLGAFGRRVESRGLDYGDNDLDLHRGGIHAQFSTPESQTDVVLGHQKKRFGARGYYGVSPDYYAQEEIRDTLFLGSSRLELSPASKLNIVAMRRELEDDYKLWLPTGLYHNEHRSTIQKARIAGENSFNSLVGLDWGMSGENEDIRSNSLGDYWREELGIKFVPHMDVAGLRFRFGSRLRAFSEESPVWLPQLGVEYGLGNGSFLHAAYCETVRQPSYTELNYESPGSLGNSGLGLQRSDNSEIGIESRLNERFRFGLCGFYRRSENAIDWLKATPADRWTAANLGLVETVGMEANLGYRSPREVLLVDFNYLYTHKGYTGEPYASRYALDYPRNLIQTVIGWQVHHDLRLLFRQGLRWQVQNAARSSGNLGYPAVFETAWTPDDLDQLTISMSIENVWNNHFQTLPGQCAADRAFVLAVRWLL